MQETRARSAVKTILWRVVATCITLGAAYALTGSLQRSTAIALVAAVIAMVAYYIHERIWNKIQWGRVK